MKESAPEDVLGENSAFLSEQSDPKDAREALSCPDSEEWKAAMLQKYHPLNKNETWTLVDRPTNTEIIKTKWVLRTKRHANGQIERRKARLVAKGLAQTPGVSYGETYAPVARMNSIRMLMPLSVELGMQIQQLDFISAYLNGEITEDVYLKIPKEFETILSNDDHKKYASNKVCKIRKALYGLKQSGRQWYRKLDEKLQSLGLQPLSSDPCVYFINKTSMSFLINRINLRR